MFFLLRDSENDLYPSKKNTATVEYYEARFLVRNFYICSHLPVI